MTTAPVGCLDEREAFEAWAWKHLKQDARSWKHPSGEYVYLQSEWNAFQAGRASVSASRQEGWISVDARLPSHEQEVICTGFEGNDPAKKRWQEFATFHECGLFYDTVLGEQLYPPTHWQPTPAAPHQSQEAQGDRHGE
jgi:hypothetical protein